MATSLKEPSTGLTEGKTLTSAGMETPEETLARAKAMTTTPITGSVSAQQIEEQTPVTPPPVPAQATLPSNQGTVSAVYNRIQEESEAAKAIKEQQAQFGSLMDNQTGFDIQEEQLQRFGVTPAKLQELEDIQLQLADMQGDSDVRKVQIAGAAGQTVSQAGREVTQEDREQAVRSATLASRAAVLQGNIETGRALANDAVNIALQDRTFNANNMIQQINWLQGQVDDETAAALEDEKRQYEQELADIAEVKQGVTAAIGTGMATSDELTTLTSMDVDDATKLALAQEIQSRAAQRTIEMEDVDFASQIAARNAGIAQGWARIDLAEREFNYKQQQDALDAELEALEAAGEITEEQAANQQKVENALRMKELIEQIRGHAGFNLSVGSLGSRIVNPFEVGLAGQLYNQLSGQGEGFDALYDQLTETLTLDNLDKMSGVLTDNDIKVLRSAATRLRKTTTEKEFLNTLQEMETTFDRVIKENGVTPQQAKFYFGVDDDTLSEIDMIYRTTTQIIGGNLDDVTF